MPRAATSDATAIPTGRNKCRIPCPYNQRVSCSAPDQWIVSVRANFASQARSTSRSEGAPEGALDVDVRVGEEAAPVQCADQPDDRRGVELTRALELVDDDGSQGPCAVEQRQQIDLRTVEPVVDEVAAVAGDRIRATASRLEPLDFDPRSQLRTPCAAFDLGRQRLPDITDRSVLRHAAVRGECRRIDTTSVALQADVERRAVLQ